MPEMGRPVSNQGAEFRQATIAPRALNTKVKSDDQLSEELINKATGQKPKSVYKDGPHNQLGKDEFLKLLTFQLQNQDPLNPMDQQKMTGELAQFSQLEQLSNLNNKFDKANQNQMIQDKFFAASFVGKEVVTSGSTLKLKEEGESADVLFKLDGDASKVVIRVLDEKNQIIGETWKENMSHGAHQVTWEGVTLDGQPAAKGNYKAVVKAWDKNGQEVMAQTHATGVVQSVSFEDGEPMLTVDGQKVYLRDVATFQLPKNNRVQQALPTAQDLNGKLPSNRLVNPQQAANSYAEQNGIYD